jgi:sulfur relay (sulfurtransferase) DsrF/TusC family protein
MGVDAILACGAFGQSVTVVIEPPAYGLLSESQEPPPGERHWFKQLQSFPLYDVDIVYVVQDGEVAPPAVDIEDLRIEVIDRTELQRLIQCAAHTLSF